MSLLYTLVDHKNVFRTKSTMNNTNKFKIRNSGPDPLGVPVLYTLFMRVEIPKQTIAVEQ